MLVNVVRSDRLWRICCNVNRPLRQFTTIVTTDKNLKNLMEDEKENEDGYQTDEQTTWQNDTDEFTSEFLNNRIQMTTFQKILLGVGSSLAALVNPRRQDMIATLGETTGELALFNMQQSMYASPEGQRILVQRPRINTRTVDLEYLRNLPENTFGHVYVKFLDDNHVTPDSRMAVRFVRNSELAYVMTRYRECHDLVHTILGMPTNMLGEVTVKWVEAFNNGLPMCYGGALFGAVRLRPKQRKKYINEYLPWAIKHGKQMKPLMPVYWEERWEQDIKDLRSEMGIQLLD